MQKANVFIPAAGFGSRMKELVADTPKPLLPVAGFPMLDFSLFLAWKWQARAFVNSHYKSEQIARYIQAVRGLEMIHCPEQTILGTAGGMKTCMNQYLNDDDYFIVLNPDLLIFPAGDFYPAPAGFSGDILLYLAPHKGNNTRLHLENDKVYFDDGDYYYMGLSVIRFGVLKDIRLNEFSDLSSIFKNLAKNHRLQGKIFPGEVFDIGNRKSYEKSLTLDISRYLALHEWESFRQSVFPGL